MAEVFVPVVFIAVIAIFVLLTRVAAKKSSANLRRVAESLGLSADADNPGFFQGEPHATGTVRGKQVVMGTYSTGSGKSRTHWCFISAYPGRDGGLSFSLRRQGFGTRVMEVFGWKEIQVGDPAFDARWFVQTNQPDFFRAALVPEIRTRIDELSNASRVRDGHLQLEKGAVRYAEQGSFSNDAIAERVGRAAEVVLDLADLAEVYASEQGKSGGP